MVSQHRPAVVLVRQATLLKHWDDPINEGVDPIIINIGSNKFQHVAGTSVQTPPF